MNTRFKSISATALLLLAAAVGGIAPAAAAESPPVDSTQETDGSARCTSGWMYQPNNRDGADSLRQFGPTYSAHNGTAVVATQTLSSTVSGTATASFQGSTMVEGSIKMVKIGATFGINASMSVTAGIGNTIQITIPPGKTGNGDFGVFGTYVLGKEVYYLPNCTAGESSAANVWAPYKLGWDTWISN